MNKKGKYSPEFKEQAVKRTLSGSLSAWWKDKRILSKIIS
ncbi:transposase [Leptospira noguchii]|nr:transposase [Leptospira noguchii]